MGLTLYDHQLGLVKWFCYKQHIDFSLEPQFLKGIIRRMCDVGLFTNEEVILILGDNNGL